MSVIKIQIRNLLSYKSIDLELGQGLNIIVGKNGSGKSNFVNALLFILTDKFTLHDRKMLENNIYQEEQSLIQVQLVLNNNKKKLPLNHEEVVITRQFSQKDEFYLMGKQITVTQFSNLMQSINLSRSNYYNIIRQGKITKISQMRDTEIYQLLEEVSGVALYEEKKAEALNNIEQAQQDREEIVKMLNDLSSQINQLQEEKEAFNQLQEIQKQIQLYEIQLQQISAKNFKHQLLGLNQESNALHQKLQQLNNQENILKDHHYKTRKQLEVQEEEQLNYKTQLSHYQNQIDILIERIKEFSDMLKQKQQQIQQMGDSNPEFRIELQQKEKNINQKLLQTQEEYAEIEKNIQFLQILQTEDPVKRLKEEVVLLQAQLEGYQKEFNNVEMKIKKTAKEYRRLKDLQKDNDTDPKQLKENYDNVQIALSERIQEQGKLKLDNMELTKIKTQIQQKLFKLQSDQDVECNLLDKAVRDIYTTSLFKILEFVEEQHLTMYGVFAQLMELKNERLITLVETASGARMLSLIVPDSETAKKIIDFNKEQQGCVLRIYSLDLIEDKINKYEIPKDTIDLNGQVTLRGGFLKKEALKQRVIGKWVGVKDYQMALSVSQRFEINCITMENEVVYSDSFITRIGATRIQQSKSAQLKKILEMYSEIKLLTQKDIQLQEKCDKNVNEELEIQREIQKMRNQVNQIQEQLKSHDQQQIDKKEYEIQSLENLAKQLDVPIQQIVQRIKEMQQQLKNPKQLKKGLNEESLDKLQQSLKLKQELAQRLSKLLNEKNEIKIQLIKKVDQLQIQQIEQEINDLNQQQALINKEITLNEQNRNENQRLLNENKNQVKQLLKQSDNLDRQLVEISLEIDSVKNQQNELDFQVKQCVQKLDNFEKDKKMVEAYDNIDCDEQQSKNQIIKTIKELKLKFNHKFTQKDQSLFEKLNDIETKFNDYQKKLQDLKLIQGEFEQLCLFMDKKAETILQDQLFKQFSEYFRYYFLKIVPSGECKVQLIKGLKKNKKNWGIDIKISFKSKELQNWTQFSSGEKTIVAFVVVIALQKCDPAPFYILDEFDAALDDNYRMQIAQIIQELSQQSQYIIVTFRQELLNLVDENIRYFKVQHHNQQSSIVKTNQNDAKKIIRN